MKYKKLASLLAVVSMLMIVAVSWMPMASAWDEEGTETIDEDSYWYMTIPFFNGDYITLSYTIEVQNNIYIDVMLLNEENYNKYRNDQSFSYYRDGTDFNTIYTNVPSISLSTHDNYYLVVDNTDDPPNGATPPLNGINDYCTFHYTISGNAHYYSGGGSSTTTWEDDEGVPSWIGGLIILVILTVIILAVFGLMALLKKKSGGQQPQQYQPPYQQPYQPPQQEQPSPQQPPQQPY